jgi:hypothetical protein
MHYVAPLIAEAWEQHHRRRNRLLIAGATSVVVAALIWLASGGPGTRAGGGGQPSAGTVNVRPSAVLARAPYMGIAVCHTKSSACYRVGVAVWLKRPAQSVTATSAGVSTSLNRTDRRGIQIIASTRRREFIGFFRTPGIVPRSYLTTPDATRLPIDIVKLTIGNGHGGTVVTRVRVPVQAGWG